MSFLRTFANSFDPSRLLMLVIQAAVALLCIIIHECAHGFAADRMGDHTARRSGRLSWNPLRHIDPFGLIMMIVAGVGWAKPVPVNPAISAIPSGGWLSRRCRSGRQFRAGLCGADLHGVYLPQFLEFVVWTGLFPFCYAVPDCLAQCGLGRIQHNSHSAAGRVQSAVLLLAGPYLFYHPAV